MYVSYSIGRLFDLIMLLLLIQVLLSWFPNINWRNEPFYTLKKFTDAVFAPLRKIIPPIGMLDISPIFTFLALDLLKELIVRLLLGAGL